ncbi:ComEA family DNA-binding protein [Longitalea arenae]|uniref:ComEA family DNA-binding protein n=1 Tax=Longitalea arenae TaxID=2812558 RepID=UPI00196728A8|nr:helix-hairpin-helix domain-containing protein [Longitalea arenae]
MESNWKDYFTFTRKERIGIYLLLAGIGICSVMPRFCKTAAIDRELTAEAFALQKAHDSSSLHADLAGLSANDHQQIAHNDIHYERVGGAQPVAGLFPFDPNTLDPAGWKRLGVSDRTANTIQRYRAKGGRFKNAADLQKVYGLKEADCKRLMPYVRITAPAITTVADKPVVKFTKTPPPLIDINRADTTAFISLPGIGSKLASRMVHLREKLGGFYAVQQVAETFGLPDSTFQLIKPRLACSPVLLQKINVNTADEQTLKQHPYIRWQIARAIVQYRQQHGLFQSPEDLQRIVLITPELYQKMAAYLAVE